MPGLHGLIFMCRGRAMPRVLEYPLLCIRATGRPKVTI